MIVNRQRRVPVAIHPLQHFYERARRELGFAPDSVTIQLISDETMARLNETFRKKHGPTDVLSFPANGARPTRGAEYVGDIAISPETARRNARRFSRSLPIEMRILILHGMIHLAGFDHETDHGEMDRLSAACENAWELPGGSGACRKMMTFLYVLGVSALGVGLVIFSYLDRIYRELGRVNKGRVREHLEFFEAEIEPHFRPGTHARDDRISPACESVAGAGHGRDRAWRNRVCPGHVGRVAAGPRLRARRSAPALAVYSGLHARSHKRTLAYPPGISHSRVSVDRLAVSRGSRACEFLARISDDQHADGSAAQEEGIGALVDAAEQEGILDPGEAQMIEQVVEFSDKRVLEFMTPRPDVIAIPANAHGRRPAQSS